MAEITYGQGSEPAEQDDAELIAWAKHQIQLNEMEIRRLCIEQLAAQNRARLMAEPLTITTI